MPPLFAAPTFPMSLRPCTPSLVAPSRLCFINWNIILKRIFVLFSHVVSARRWGQPLLYGFGGRFRWEALALSIWQRLLLTVCDS